MWNKPWTMKEGFVIGGGLIAAGLALELSVGPVVWDAFSWPVNGIVLAGFLALIAIAEVPWHLPCCHPGAGVCRGSDPDYGTYATEG